MSTAIDLVIVGAGGQGRQLFDVVAAHNRVATPTYRVLGFLDDGRVDEQLLARMGTRHLGPTGLLSEVDAEVAVGVGSPGPRRMVDQLVKAAGREPVSFVHPQAVIGSLGERGPGLFVSAGAVIDTNVTIGRLCHVNWGVSIGHESVIGDWVTLTPGVRISGSCTIGDGVFVGTNACVIPGVTIGADVVVGAGVVVRHDLPPGVTFVGADHA